VEKLLELEELVVQRGEAEVLHKVSLKVMPGEIVAVVGSNGAGKTTMLRTISGLLPLTEGKIVFENTRIDKMPAYKISGLGIAHIPEGRRLFPGMTVLDNLEIGAYSKRARPRLKQLLGQVFDLFPRLAERQQQLAGTLSGGEQQMVAIGRSLMSDPKLLMLDEPSLGLAPKIVQEVFEFVRMINKLGVTVMIVEQNVQQCLKVADRAYVLENGSIVLEGTGKELLGKPAVKEAYLGL
jgi:branched-chain amino acid transport system ATP-binding protein